MLHIGCWSALCKARQGTNNRSYVIISSDPCHHSEAERVVMANMRCLNDSSDTVRRAALKHATEVFHYSREHSTSYLMAIFQQGKPAAWELRQLLTVSTSFLK